MEPIQQYTQAKSPSVDSLSWNNWSLEPSLACSGLHRSVRCLDLRVYAYTDEQMTRSPCSTPSTRQSLTRINSGFFLPETPNSANGSPHWKNSQALHKTNSSTSVNSCKRIFGDANYDDNDELSRSKKPRYSHNSSSHH